MAKLFFSYSHQDETLRNELDVHLSPLKREGLIESWHDRRLVAGDEFAGEISEKLESADIILLLISHHFLASDYCYDLEMKRAMERHAAKQARVIPVILTPCDWKSSPFGKLLAMPTDGRPITKFADVHDGYLDVVKAIRDAVAVTAGNRKPPQLAMEPNAPPATRRPETRSSNLNVQKSFTDHDRDTFQDQAFEYIATYFEESLAELSRRNPEITTRFKRIDGQRFTAQVYRDGKSVSECSIRTGGSMMLGSGIAYSHDASSTNSLNESLSIADNGTSLFLKALGFSFGGQQEKELTFEGGAELFWGLLMRPLQSRIR